jgi:hypothetical protein
VVIEAAALGATTPRQQSLVPRLEVLKMLAVSGR